MLGLDPCTEHFWLHSYQDVFHDMTDHPRLVLLDCFFTLSHFFVSVFIIVE